MARGPRHGAYPGGTASSTDPGKDRALGSDAEEPHPAGKLLPARRTQAAHRTDAILRQVRPAHLPAVPNTSAYRNLMFESLRSNF